MKTIRQWVGGEYYEGSPLGVIPVENPEDRNHGLFP